MYNTTTACSLLTHPSGPGFYQLWRSQSRQYQHAHIAVPRPFMKKTQLLSARVTAAAASLCLIRNAKVPLLSRPEMGKIAGPVVECSAGAVLPGVDELPAAASRMMGSGDVAPKETYM